MYLHDDGVSCILITEMVKVVARPTILILAKLRSPFSVKLGVPSSMKVRSDKYIPRYGIQGGSHLKTRIIRLGLKPNIYFFRPRKKNQGRMSSIFCLEVEKKSSGFTRKLGA